MPDLLRQKDTGRSLVLVFVDSPKYEKMGGLVAGPVFASIMGDVLRYYKIEPTTETNTINSAVSARKSRNYDYA